MSLFNYNMTQIYFIWLKLKINIPSLNNLSTKPPWRVLSDPSSLSLDFVVACKAIIVSSLWLISPVKSLSFMSLLPFSSTIWTPCSEIPCAALLVKQSWITCAWCCVTMVIFFFNAWRALTRMSTPWSPSDAGISEERVSFSWRIPITTDGEWDNLAAIFRKSATWRSPSKPVGLPSSLASVSIFWNALLEQTDARKGWSARVTSLGCSSPCSGLLTLKYSSTVMSQMNIDPGWWLKDSGSSVDMEGQ